MNNILIINSISSIFLTILPSFIPFSSSANSQTINKPVNSVVKIANKSYELVTQIAFDEGDAYITVPENNVTARHIGRLRKYDFHIAKMFEVTAFMCEEGIVSPGIDWHYYAGRGNIDMGTFKISCSLADTIVNAYKVRSPEPTAIEFSQGEDHPPEIRNYRIGILDIERDPNKTTRWLKFVQKFKPVRQ
ncbi:hypothetical protein [Aulosira sp. FACHB-615]|uniref:hypothetical protein n=1 Tax=Aulosira sp. FACHB-615 TaxID=2692777 RepID=UPI001687F77B|nr:hypothetical protein [Aulosira sp. FACHB-615]MBD2492099.1 hypothetical protein [Aulosira sp. FACHB-615]